MIVFIGVDYLLLYIHIPFCESKCPYCAFGSLVGKNDRINLYFQALKNDLFYWISKLNLSKSCFETLFIGGGTPSVVKAYFYESIFECLEPFLHKDAEITVEANPNSITYEWIAKMKELGVNRLSMGVQSFFEDKLKMLGRTHDINSVINAVKFAKRAQIDRISIDIIYGTMLDNESRLKNEILNASKLEIEHVSAYSLTLEEGTPFYKKYELANDDDSLAMLVIDEIQKAGFKQYEVSNFGNPCLHNLGYWQGKEYLGIGAYSVGFIGNSRFYALKNLDEYINKPEFRDIEILSDDDIFLEKLFLGFRSCVGVEFDILNKIQKEKANNLLKENKIMINNGRMYANNYLIADELALYFTS